MRNIIYHYDESLCEQTGYSQNQEFKRHALHSIIDHVLSKNLNVMLTPHKNGINVLIDGEHKFKQR